MRKEFENYLNKYIEKYKKNDELYEALNYALNTGGKRIRPLLCMHMANNINKDYTKILDIALAIEFIHSYSLVHDDLPGMDNSKYRRDKLTVHAKYGEYIAILVGDALLTEAFNILANSNLKYKCKHISTLSYYSGYFGMIYGQYLDMKYENKSIEYSLLKEIHYNKTACLLIASLKMVADEFLVDDTKYIKIAEYLGLIYQIQDDIFDMDNKDDKSNIVNIIGFENSKKILNELKEKIEKLLENEKILRIFIEKIIERDK